MLFVALTFINKRREKKTFIGFLIHHIQKKNRTEATVAYVYRGIYNSCKFYFNIDTSKLKHYFLLIYLNNTQVKNIGEMMNFQKKCSCIG